MRVLGDFPLLQSTCHSVIHWFPVAVHVSRPDSSTRSSKSCRTCHSTPRGSCTFIRSRKQLTHAPAKLQNAAVPPYQMLTHGSPLSHQRHHLQVLLQSQRATSHMQVCLPNQTLTLGKGWKQNTNNRLIVLGTRVTNKTGQFELGFRWIDRGRFIYFFLLGGVDSGIWPLEPNSLIPYSFFIFLCSLCSWMGG
ncbi:hypothetical protein Syun_009422 [Stephania yunnanensis]|uniref:Uncharacterized protein n=1 Tax=Stephania yunnanensis TaxID=152371 RepID=A0AAP0KG48_9MAGN